MSHILDTPALGPDTEKIIAQLVETGGTPSPLQAEFLREE